jgi:hypothetical protein
MSARVSLAVPAVLAVLLTAPGCRFLPGIPSFQSCRGKNTVTRQSKKEKVDCSYSNLTSARDGCVTRTISCGDSFMGDTHGGAPTFQDDFYQSKFCLPFGHDYTGPDRTFLFDLPARQVADLWLDSDCVDLDLFAFQWTYDGKCPTVNHLISVCEADDAKGDGHVRLSTTDRPAEYLVTVDGKSGVTGPFRLTVDCGGR